MMFYHMAMQFKILELPKQNFGHKVERRRYFKPYEMLGRSGRASLFCVAFCL